MAFQVSPGINVSEIDLTAVVPSVATTSGGFAGNFRWGPVEQVVLITSEDRLVENFRAPVADHANNAADFMCAANFLAYSNQLNTVRVVDVTTAFNAVANTDGTASANSSLLVKNEDDYEDNYAGGQTRAGIFYARYPGALGNSLKVSVCASPEAFEQSLTCNVSITKGTKSMTLHSNPSIANTVIAGDLLLIGPDKQERKVLTVAANTITLTTAYTGNTITAADGNLTRRWEYFRNFDRTVGTSSFANTGNGTNDEMHVVVADEGGDITGNAGQVLEIFPNVSKAKDAKSTQGEVIYYKDKINTTSNWIFWNKHESTITNAGSNAKNTTFGTPSLPINGHFVNGADGDTARDADFITGYNKFRNKESIDMSLLVAGGANQTRIIHLINEIAEVRKDCIVCISPEKADVVNNARYDGSEVDDIVAFRNTLPSSSFAVMDSGYKYQYDRYNDVYRYVPLNGDTAGLMVRTDNTRDPWYSPAGFNRGNIKNSIKLAFSPRQAERDVLYQKGINPVVSFPGQGTVLFGDKTMQGTPSAFDRINVRRLFIVLEKAIEAASQTTLFELNDEITRAQFKNLVEPFLRDVQSRRGITDFRVICDDTNNTPEIIDRNEFVGDIFVKPNRSINYIQLNFVAVRSGVEFTEVVGAV